MIYYTKGYHGVFVRFLQSFFIQLPLTIWFRVSPLFLFWRNTGFVNHTSLPTSQLQSIWNQAAQELATKPIPMNTSGGGVHAPDPRAANVAPENVTVVSVPDWFLADLAKISPAWSVHKPPSGTFAITTGLSYETVHGVTLPWHRPRIYGAESVLAGVLVWEFQNVILARLGYDVSNR